MAIYLLEQTIALYNRRIYYAMRIIHTSDGNLRRNIVMPIVAYRWDEVNSELRANYINLHGDIIGRRLEGLLSISYDGSNITDIVVNRRFTAKCA